MTSWDLRLIHRIGVEYGSNRLSPGLPSKVKTFQTLAADVKEGGKMAHSLRSVGSAAINIALVACGGLDMYWEIGVSVATSRPDLEFRM